MKWRRLTAGNLIILYLKIDMESFEALQIFLIVTRLKNFFWKMFSKIMLSGFFV